MFRVFTVADESFTIVYVTDEARAQEITKSVAKFGYEPVQVDPDIFLAPEGMVAYFVNVYPTGRAYVFEATPDITKPIMVEFSQYLSVATVRLYAENVESAREQALALWTEAQGVQDI